MHSTLFRVFGIPVFAYGTMMVVGFALGLWRAVRVGKARGMRPEPIYDIALVALLSGVLGARFVFVLINPETESFRQFFATWNGGLSFHGGVGFATLATYVYVRIARVSFWQYVDLLTPSVAIGYAFTRIGCFLNGCCYGSPTTLPWGVRFSENGVLTPPSHPTQIYATLANLLIFFILTRLEKLPKAPGFVFVSYLGMYAIYRFGIEFLRSGYSAAPWALGLTQAQAVSVATVVICGVVLAVGYRGSGERSE